MGDNIIEIYGLSKRYRIPNLDGVGLKDFWALKDINFTVEKGAAVAILGENGSGKSTLFKLISEVTCPTEGGIIVQGTISSLLEVGIGFHPELTGKENIYLNGAFLGMRKGEIDEKLEAIITLANQFDFINMPIKRYSSGMRTRLAFAIAANLQTDILILDEVLAVSDRKFQEMAIEEVQQRISEGGTILMSSHDPNVLKEVCTRAIILNNGKLIGEGPYEQMTSEYLQIR